MATSKVENIIDDVFTRLKELKTAGQGTLTAKTVERVFTSPIELGRDKFPAIFILDSETTTEFGGEGTDWARVGQIRANMNLSIYFYTIGSTSFTDIRELAWDILRKISGDPERSGNARDTELISETIDQGWTKEHRDIASGRQVYRIVYTYKKRTIT